MIRVTSIVAGLFTSSLSFTRSALPRITATTSLKSRAISGAVLAMSGIVSARVLTRLTRMGHSAARVPQLHRGVVPPREVERAVHELEMCERLREVAQQPLRRRVVLLRDQAEVV